MEIGKLAKLTDLKIEGTDLLVEAMAPQGIMEATPSEWMKLLRKNWHGNRIEMRGFIPRR
jgi:hypothetical protein